MATTGSPEEAAALGWRYERFFAARLRALAGFFTGLVDPLLRPRPILLASADRAFE